MNLPLSRRELLAGVGGAALSAGAASAFAQQSAAGPNDAQQRRVRQSVMGWCFDPMDPLTLARHGKQIGLVAIEGISADHYPAIKELGLEISLVGSHGFRTGPLDPDNHAEVEAKLRESIDTAVAFGAPSVITFTGMQKQGISDRQAKKNCLDCWRRVVPYAEEKNITLVLEHLNSKDDSHPMKGHPGYWGDDIERCIDLIREIDSPQFKLLFDIYHVQVMHGDIIRKIRQYHPLIGHYHTAGNPGRGELDDTQEINYPGVIRAILETGYDGYIAQEFIPTWSDPIAALEHAFRVCEVS